MVLWRELQDLGYRGGYSTLKDSAERRGRQRSTGDSDADAGRFETALGEQAQADWGSFSYVRR